MSELVSGGKEPPDIDIDPGPFPSNKDENQVGNMMECTNMDIISQKQENQNVSTNLISNSPGKNGNASNNNEKVIRQVYLYTNKDTGPYHVYIENCSQSFNGKLNALKVGDIILSAFPELDSKITNIDSIGRNRIRIKLTDYKNANYLINQKNSTVFVKNNLELYIPKFILFRQGVIRDIDIEFSEEYIKSKIRQYDSHCNFDIVNVRRIKRKEETVENDSKKINYVPTKSCIVSFKCQVLPRYISINKVIKEVEHYTQKVLLCFNCLRFGHLGGQCKGHPRCGKCQESHNTKECQKIDYIPKCFSCQGNHYTTNLSVCPEFKRQKLIKEAMSFSNISFFDANKQVPKTSYADILNKRNTSHPIDSLVQPTSSTYLQPTSFSATVQNISKVNSSRQQFASHLLYNNTSNEIKGKPNKRQRPNTPDPSEQIRKEIISQVNVPSTSGGILSSPYYRKTNITDRQSEDLDPSIINVILELVMKIVNSLQQTNNLNVSESEIIQLISKHVNPDVLSNSQT
uniref:Uncharacterized protein LOC114330598 n=1 Tax=Diabrotica virgifera virgifera TaxID=50390 RepID=A0A6P7FS66_DIAVI